MKRKMLHDDAEGGDMDVLPAPQYLHPDFETVSINEQLRAAEIAAQRALLRELEPSPRYLARLAKTVKEREHRAGKDVIEGDCSDDGVRRVRRKTSEHAENEKILLQLSESGTPCHRELFSMRRDFILPDGSADKSSEEYGKCLQLHYDKIIEGTLRLWHARRCYKQLAFYACQNERQWQHIERIGPKTESWPEHLVTVRSPRIKCGRSRLRKEVAQDSNSESGRYDSVCEPAETYRDQAECDERAPSAYHAARPALPSASPPNKPRVTLPPNAPTPVSSTRARVAMLFPQELKYHADNHSEHHSGEDSEDCREGRSESHSDEHKENRAEDQNDDYSDDFPEEDDASSSSRTTTPERRSHCSVCAGENPWCDKWSPVSPETILAAFMSGASLRQPALLLHKRVREILEELD